MLGGFIPAGVRQDKQYDGGKLGLASVGRTRVGCWLASLIMKWKTRAHVFRAVDGAVVSIDDEDDVGAEDTVQKV